jgi:hypothetical protein
MKQFRKSLAIVINVTLVSMIFLGFAIQTVQAQDSRIALQRGYRTGYSDGYMAGYRDVSLNAARDARNHSEYIKADRAYSKSHGDLEDYRDGYQQGFEGGYAMGFDKKLFDSTLPNEIRKRGTIAANTTVTNNPQYTTVQNTAPAENYIPATTQNTTTTATSPQYTEAVMPVTATVANLDGQIVIIPADTELIVEMLGPITTSENKNGDRFQAKVVSPYEISGAIIEGRIEKITKPGRIKKRSQLQLSFDQIRLTQERWSNFNALLTEVLPMKGDNVRKVDNEGAAIGKSSIKPDALKVGAATGTGLVVGAVVAGPVGAGVGAAMGAAFGVGAVVVERGKHIKLIKGQQLRIRTAYETQIR